MRSECRGSAPRENSRFQLRTQPCRRGGGVCRCLLSPSLSLSFSFFLLSNIGMRTAMRLSRMTRNYRPSFFSRFFFFSFFPGPLPNVSAGGQANHRATTREWTELCALRMNDTRKERFC